MKLSLCLAAVLLLPITASAQSIGIGGGYALSSASIAQLPTELREHGWSEIDRNVATGFYVELRGRLGLGLPLTGSVSYNRFPEETTRYTDGSGNSFSVVSSQVVVPASAGVEFPFSEGTVVPFATVEATASYLYRTFESTEGDVPLPLRTEQQGDARFGGALGLGLMLDLPLLRVDATARYHLLNLFGREGEEDLISFGQIGLVLWVGL